EGGIDAGLVAHGSALGQQLAIGRRVEQLVEIAGIARLDPDHPAAGVGRLVDELGLVVEPRVDLDDLAVERRVEIRHGLDRVDVAEALAALDRLADAGQRDGGDVTELLDRVGGDADGDGPVVVAAGPLVVFGVAEGVGQVAHWSTEPAAARPGRGWGSQAWLCHDWGRDRLRSRHLDSDTLVEGTFDNFDGDQLVAAAGEQAGAGLAV